MEKGESEEDRYGLSEETLDGKEKASVLDKRQLYYRRNEQFDVVWR